MSDHEHDVYRINFCFNQNVLFLPKCSFQIETLAIYIRTLQHHSKKTLAWPVNGTKKPRQKLLQNYGKPYYCLVDSLYYQICKQPHLGVATLFEALYFHQRLFNVYKRQQPQKVNNAMVKQIEILKRQTHSCSECPSLPVSTCHHTLTNVIINWPPRVNMHFA